MTTVIDMNSRRPHLAGMAQCMACGNRHVAVTPVGTYWCECPACHLMQAVWVNPVERGHDSWQCKCGSLFFRITSARGVYCARCGETQVGF